MERADKEPKLDGAGPAADLVVAGAEVVAAQQGLGFLIQMAATAVLLLGAAGRIVWVLAVVGA